MTRETRERSDAEKESRGDESLTCRPISLAVSPCRRVAYCEAGASLDESPVDSPAAGGDDTVLT